MNFLIRKNHLNKNMLFEGGYQVREPSRAEKEFWTRIKELEIALTEIATRVRRVPFRLGGAAQIVLSAEQMAEIAEKALRSPQRL